MRAQIDGLRLGTVYEGTRRTPLVIKGQEKLRNSSATFARLHLVLPDGKRVALTSLVKMERTEGPVSVQREKGKRMSVVIASVSGRDLVSFVEDAKVQVAEQVKLPTGFYLE